MNKSVSTKNTEHYTWGGDCDGWHLLKLSAASVIQERMPPGRAETRHVHQRSQQFFFLLSGQVTLEVDGEAFRLRKQQGCYVAAGLPHSLRNEGRGAAEFLVISVPPSHGDRRPVTEESCKSAKGTWSKRSSIPR